MSSPSDAKSSLAQARPSVRRKSSASNLLIQSFGGPAKAAPINPTVAAIASPLGVAGITAVSLSGPGMMYPAKLDTETMSMSTGGDSIGSSILNSIDELQEIIRKRIVSLTYLRNVHEGKAHWIGTIHLSRADLERAFPNNNMKKRTTRYAVLAMSLASTLEFSGSISDFLATITDILGAYDSLADDVLSRPRGVKIPGFRNSRLRGNRADATELTDTYLTIPNIPYPLDYTQVLLSFIDVLTELYNKMGSLMAAFQTSQTQAKRSTPSVSNPQGPASPPPMSATSSNAPTMWSSSNAASTYSAMTLGLANWPLPGPPLQPQHGIDYLRTLAAPGNGVEEILELAESVGGSAGVAGSKVIMSDLASPTVTPTGVVEHAKKVDEKFKKMLAKLFTELDELARESIRSELKNLDPLLRSVADDPYDTYEM
ncbi:hypothetical protein BKA62DRAFT_824838 [Auriculariales sp. MPI-PUGE-AT-0066]|nr:hypothetical protein BKA62DRAFT_824838 [Auriculariales sp. MPI-PUGE-AT-0066]